MTGQTEGEAPRPLAASGEFERTAPELCSPLPRCLHRKRSVMYPAARLGLLPG